MFSDSVLHKNSIIHRLNPTLKFISFVLLIVIVFLPLGFFAQTIMVVILLTLFFLSKLPRKVLFNIFKSIIFLFVILFLINWALYKEPLFENASGKFDLIIGNFNIANYLPTYNLGTQNQGIFVSQLWGGQLGDGQNIFLNPNNKVLIEKIITENNISSKVLESTWNKLNLENQQNLLKIFSNNIDDAKKYLWTITNDWTLNGINYKVLIADNCASNMQNQVIYYHTNWYSLSPRAIQLALYVTIKVFLMILAATLLTATTNSIELTYALENLLSPLKLFRLPVNEAAMIIAIALRFIPSLLNESKRIMNAQASRGIDFKNGNFMDKSKSLISLVVPLFSIAFKKADELANAMDARSYNPRYARSKYRIFRITFSDWVGYFFITALFGFAIAITICPLLFTPYGIFEIAVLV